MIKKQKGEIKELDSDIDQLKLISADFLQEHNNNVDKHNYILETIKKSFQRQSEIDYQVHNTNNLIFQSKLLFI